MALTEMSGNKRTTSDTTSETDGFAAFPPGAENRQDCANFGTGGNRPVQAINCLKSDNARRPHRPGGKPPKERGTQSPLPAAKEREDTSPTSDYDRGRSSVHRHSGEWESTFSRKDSFRRGCRDFTRDAFGVSHHDDRMRPRRQWESRKGQGRHCSRGRNFRSSRDQRDRTSAGILSRRARSRSWEAPAGSEKRYPSPSVDSEEEYRRSRSREKARRRKQASRTFHVCNAPVVTISGRKVLSERGRSARSLTFCHVFAACSLK